VNGDHVPQSRGGTAGRSNATASANARRGVPDRRLARRRRVLLWPPQPDASSLARQGAAVPDPAYPGHPDTRWACGSGEIPNDAGKVRLLGFRRKGIGWCKGAFKLIL